jgi:hypothetical protein
LAQDADTSVKEKIKRFQTAQDSPPLVKAFSHQDHDVDYSNVRASDSKKSERICAARKDSDDENQ